VQIGEGGYGNPATNPSFSGVLNIPDTVINNNIIYNVTAIERWAFYDCSFSSVVIGNSVTSIGAMSFAECRNLTSLTIGSAVQSIEGDSFSGSPNLTTLVFKGMTAPALDSYSLAVSASTGVVSYPAGATGYERDVLTAARLPVGWVLIEGGVGAGGIFVANSTEDIPVTYQVLTEDGTNNTVQVGTGSSTSSAVAADSSGSLTIPAAVTSSGGLTYTVQSVGNYAFSNCTSLTSVTIPDSVTSIGNYALRGCIGLSSVVIPNMVTSLGTYVFAGCNSLASITVGSSVTSIGSYAFQNCTSLATLTFKGDAAPTLGANRFTNLPTPGTVYYPEGATGYVQSTFTTAGLPATWTFVAVPTVTEPQVGAPGSGDLDGDGVTASDALRVARAVISGIGDLTPEQVAAADMDGDNVLTMADVVRILRRAAGLS
jgi:hypothetical protein